MNLRPYLVALAADGRAQVKMDLLRPHGQSPPQSLEPPFQDSRGRTAPARMQERHPPPLRVDDVHRHAVRQSHRQQQTGLCGQMTIALGEEVEAG